MPLRSISHYKNMKPAQNPLQTASKSWCVEQFAFISVSYTTNIPEQFDKDRHR
jgi:L-cystine uptake protein TcyP (sodium:dicarboxylate symporter family)